MAEARRYALTPQLDIQQILHEAQHRWLRPAEICEILRNYRNFRIAPEPPNRPCSGSLFLFDRKVLRYFRKDGHNWRKKKDGKTVKEAHERLKSGSIDVLHCYYAHGEENENFQRRTYWMLEEDFMHIVFVHYREVKNSKASYTRTRDAEENARVAQMDSPAGSSSFTNQSQLPSQVTDAGSPISTQTSEYEDTESDNYQANSRYNSLVEMQQYGDGPMTDIHVLNSYAPVSLLNDQGDHQRLRAAGPESNLYSVSQEGATRVFDGASPELTWSGSKSKLGLTSWEEVLEHCTPEFKSAPFDPTVASGETANLVNPQQFSLMLGEYFPNDMGLNQGNIASAQGSPVWQLDNAEVGSPVMSNLDVENELSIEGNHAYASLLKQLSLDLSHPGEGLKKNDSFSRWMSSELGEVDDSQLQSTSGAYWNTIESESVGDVSSMSNQEQLDSYLVSPSISQEQLFSIVDFSPSWAYTGLETKVLISGTFLRNKEYVEKCNWSCMFGEIEVPADILVEGTLCCHAPPHKAGRVPFYITCSNRLACSEVREFEYREKITRQMHTSNFYGSMVNEMDLYKRLEKLLSLGTEQPKPVSRLISEKQHLISEINSLMVEVDDEWFNMLIPRHEREVPSDSTRDWFLEKRLKDKLHVWLLYKVAEDGKGPSVLDNEGQGVLHLAAALGYDWAITPTITAGVSVNFRDVHGWTALHWAAFYGREQMIATLIGLGAATGALTDPSPEFPSGRTPADLASSSGHKGIAGFLAECSLTSHLVALTLKDSKGGDLAEVSGVTGTGDSAAQAAIQPPFDGDLSLKDSLSAVRNATQAAARIHQVFRVQSFHRKKLVEYGDDKCGLSDERALSLLSVKAAKPGQHDLPVHAAAVRIQNKFRGWKGRKEFLIIRQRIVKIQAHVRGHQVRKHYKKIVWTVLVVEKAILRWRRKKSGLRGFRSEGLIEGPSAQNKPSKEDDYDFLKEGRKQTEARLEKALARVKSMVQYPEARDQYRRLQTVVTKLQEPKVAEVQFKKKHPVLTEERKATKKKSKRRKRAQKEREQGVKRLKLQPVVKPKEVKYCNFYLAGRCQQGEACKFSHDTTPLTKSQPCKYLATDSCLKGDDCPFDHELSKYPCHNYMSKGMCIRGERCKFSHKMPMTEGSSPVSVAGKAADPSSLVSQPKSSTAWSSQLIMKKLSAGNLVDNAKLSTPISPQLIMKKPLAENSVNNLKLSTTISPPPPGIRFLSFGKGPSESGGNKQRSNWQQHKKEKLLAAAHNILSSQHKSFPAAAQSDTEANTNACKNKSDDGSLQTEVSEASKLLEEFLFCS